jgi:ATP-binding cassette subfamily B protein
MNDLSTIRRLMSFGLVFLMLNILQIVVVTAILLAMYWPLGVVVLASVLPVTLTVLRFERAFTTLSRQAQDQAGVCGHPRRGGRPGLRAVKSFGREEYVFERFDGQARRLYEHTGGESGRLGPVLDAVGGESPTSR